MSKIKLFLVCCLFAHHGLGTTIHADSGRCDFLCIIGSMASATILSLVPKAGYFSETGNSGFGKSIGPEFLVQRHTDRNRCVDQFAGVVQFAVYYSHIELNQGRNLFQAKFQPTLFLSSTRFLESGIPGGNPHSGFAVGIPAGFFFDGKGGVSLGLALEYFLPLCKLVLSYEAYIGLYSDQTMHSIQFGLRNPF
jgi:hypothetical protein